VTDLQEVAPAFVDLAHRIVWATVATVDTKDRPRSRILHPIWEWDGEALTGWIATAPTPLKRAHLERSPFVTVNYWDPTHDTCTADCRATLLLDDESRAATWARFASGPAPVGYDPSIVPGWDSPASEGFAALRLDPWHLRVFPGTVLLQGQGTVLDWRQNP
jgi:hypothetical protein